ncbi:hypothetical protein B9Z51_00630 [Limnohabitans sp. T6-5]|nr:hypothetical protein B9Z51_00630 [Limnohabitans sp. T6-5]
MFNRVRDTQEIRAAMWPPGGKSEEDGRTANAEKAHAGDYAAACKRIAQLEIALQDVEDQHSDLKQAYDLAQGTAEVLAQKGEKAPSVDQVEHFLQMNRQFCTDLATEGFFNGVTHVQRKAATLKGQQNIAKVEAWLNEHGVRYRGIEAAARTICEATGIGFRTVQPVVSNWVKKHGYALSDKKI